MNMILSSLPPPSFTTMNIKSDLFLFKISPLEEGGVRGNLTSNKSRSLKKLCISNKISATHSDCKTCVGDLEKGSGVQG